MFMFEHHFFKLWALNDNGEGRWSWSTGCENANKAGNDDKVVKRFESYKEKCKSLFLNWPWQFWFDNANSLS